MLAFEKPSQNSNIVILLEDDVDGLLPVYTKTKSKVNNQEAHANFFAEAISLSSILSSSIEESGEEALSRLKSILQYYLFLVNKGEQNFEETFYKALKIFSHKAVVFAHTIGINLKLISAIQRYLAMQFYLFTNDDGTLTQNSA